MNNIILVAALIFAGVLVWFMNRPATENQDTQSGNDFIATGTPTNLVLLDDLPDELRSEVAQQLKQEESQGFGDVSDFEANEIVDIEQYIIGTDFHTAKLIFEPSVLPSSITDSYDYVGYTHPNYSIKPAVAKMKNGTLRRIFNHHESGQILIIEESSDSIGPGAVLLNEAVNTYVAEQPAIFGLKKSPNNKTFVSLNWTTEKVSYTLYQIGEQENAKEDLGRLGIEISLANK